ncbi:PQQ-binding-like beta-propeller repeat protein [Streptomyces xiamenensis]|uniref:outer membrane protein assembly factor BamB family protein n=1 Tax=Streptomyces xiamenensis TaxID=408015 RepID=UPI0035E33CB5
MRTINGAGALVTAGLLLALTACGSDAAHEAETPPTTSDSAHEERSDEQMPAPVAFADDPVRTIDIGPLTYPYPPVALHENVAWVVDEESLTGVDLTTGKDIARIAPEGRPLYEAWTPEEGELTEGEAAEREATAARRQLEEPAVLDLAGRDTVVATIPVAGASGPELEVIAADAGTGDVLWRLPLRPDGLGDGQERRVSAAVVHGQQERVALMVTEGGRSHSTVAINTSVPEVAWESEENWAWFGDGGILGAGNATALVSGIDIEDGETVWEQQLDLPRISPAGPYLVVTEGTETSVIALATGDDVDSAPGLTGDMSCWTGEGGTTLVCASPEDGAVAVDLALGPVLWQLSPDDLPDSIRAVAFQDTFYLEADEGMTVMDSRTGEIVGSSSGPFLSAVSGHGGAALVGHTIELYPAAP